jgi:hypothetical protein
MKRFAILALVLLPALATADDARDRKARAALALAKSADPTAAAVAPMPRPAKPKDYAKGHKQAADEQLPLVVYVGCDLAPVEGAVACQWDSYPGVKGPAIVVGYPVGDRIVQDAVLACPAPAGELKKAVKCAAGKCQDVKPMPGRVVAPAPLDWQISADRPGCVCGDGCRCATGECPGACPAPAINDGLDELNAKRAARGLRPYVRDDGLTAAAHACASYRATYRIFGHAPGRMGDFAFLPAGVSADSAGCAAYPPEYGWLSCCMWENASHAGAAWVMGADGRRFMHVFVRNGGPPAPAVQAAPAVVVAAPAPVVAQAAPVFVGYRTVCRGNYCELVPVYRNP